MNDQPHRIAPGSGLYVGKIAHQRFSPKKHAFSYRVWHLLLDVDDLWRLHEKVDGFKHNRKAPVEFRDTDHFGPAARPVKDKLRDFLAGQGRELPGGRVLVLTYPRVHGYVFNPVSFWFCHDEAGQLAMVVSEVNNTFGDSYSYILDELEPDGADTYRARARKVLHVSPFLPVEDHEYTFTIRPPRAEPGTDVGVILDVADPDGEMVLSAALEEERQPLTTQTLRRARRTHPLITLRTVAAIHWQAAKIWTGRKARFRKRPEALPNGYPPVDLSPRATEGAPDGSGEAAGSEAGTKVTGGEVVEAA